MEAKELSYEETEERIRFELDLGRRKLECLPPPAHELAASDAARWLHSDLGDLLEAFRWGLEYAGDKESREAVAWLMIDVIEIARGAPRGAGPRASGDAYSETISAGLSTPACKADTGSATERVELIGISSVTRTPMPKIASITSIKSGLLFTTYPRTRYYYLFFTHFCGAPNLQLPFLVICHKANRV